MAWLDGLGVLQWLKADDLLIFMSIWSAFYVVLAVKLWSAWPDSLATRLGVAALLTSAAMVFEGFRRYFGYDLPLALSWLQAALAGGGNIIAWLFLRSLCNSRFRLHPWHLALVLLAIVARLTAVHDELANFAAGVVLEVGPFIEAMTHVNWIMWQVGLVAMASVLILAGPGSRSRAARRAWVLFSASTAYEVLTMVVTRVALPDGFWPIKMVFLSGFGSWLLWSAAFLYLVHHPRLRIGPEQPVRPVATGT